MTRLIFCGGFGALQGTDLRGFEIISIASNAFYFQEHANGSDFSIELHTAKGSWQGEKYELLANYLDNLGIKHYRIGHEAEIYTLHPDLHGAHCSDFLRYLVLAHSHEAYTGPVVYNDTDNFCVSAKFWREIEDLSEGDKLVVPRQHTNARKLHNAFLYQPTSNPITYAMYNRYRISSPEDFIKWDNLSCGYLGKKAKEFKEHIATVHPHRFGIHVTGEKNQFKQFPQTDFHMLSLYLKYARKKALLEDKTSHIARLVQIINENIGLFFEGNFYE